MVLDTLLISDDAKAFAEATFMKKRMYYNMRIKTLQRNSSNILKLIKVGKNLRTFKLDIDITRLTKKLYMVTRERDERTILPQSHPNELARVVLFGDDKTLENPLDVTEHSQLLYDLERKQSLFEGRIHDKNEDLKDLELIYSNLKSRVFTQTE